MDKKISDDVVFLKSFTPKNKVRFVTATSLFDGHDASINIMRRMLQARGAEVIHLGHNRSVEDVVTAAIQEDVQGIAVSCYQGGHNEYFSYMREALDSRGHTDVQIFGGGGGVITLEEKRNLESRGINRIFSPEEGQLLGLDGMIGYILKECDFIFKSFHKKVSFPGQLARSLSLIENKILPLDEVTSFLEALRSTQGKIPVLGITGTGGAGKSSLVDELLQRFMLDFPELRIALICIDPSKKKTGGALLGDRLRINSASNARIFLRSFASRDSGSELAKISRDALAILQTQNFDLLIVETSGIGQGDSGICEVADYSMYVMTPEYGASTQLEKIDMLDFADFIVVNKYERRHGMDAVQEVQTTLRRNRFKGVPQETYPVFGTIASRFNDDGVNGLYKSLVEKLEKYSKHWHGSLDKDRAYSFVSSQREALVPTHRENYLAEISHTVRNYHKEAKEEVKKIKDVEALSHALSLFKDAQNKDPFACLQEKKEKIWNDVSETVKEKLGAWESLKENYSKKEFIFTVRQQKISIEARFTTLAQLDLPRVSLPDFESKADLVKFFLLENVPGSFPYTGGLFPFRRNTEDPKRQFAGEGGPQRTNKRFHYLAKDDRAKRLSTAFDSVTLYGSEPDRRPDIYGKVGESGVSIAHLGDMKELFKGFDLCNPYTSVSMTINGPAPIILAMFFNTAIDQEKAKFVETSKRNPDKNEEKEIIKKTLSVIRGTVQADILKEDQAQNTCIFSTEFSLKLMGDVQKFFIENSVQNYYSVSISGYHIAEAGANPITQLAFTLANGFTFVEYYLARGMDINDFAPNLAFFFSNGIDAEYGVLGRVARRIWAIAMRDRYGANERAQKLKYHIQTSGRSLHAQEMTFNDIRTTLQALMALYDNCNSLHTNAFDEAFTTPTEDSVRQAMAIQKIINEEYGLNKCENINQGSFFMEELTNLVEESVLKEFERISQRGGVLGAMESQYQRNKIQEESLYYEHLKHTGELPIIGVNTFLNPAKDPMKGMRPETQLTRSNHDEKDEQLERLRSFKEEHQREKDRALFELKKAVIEERNVFAELMKTVRFCSLYEITSTLYQVGGQYRRSM